MNDLHKASIQYMSVAFLLLFLPLIFGQCSGGENELKEKLPGKWIRTDGNYTLDVKELAKGEMLDVAYLNPNSIHVGRSEWQINEGKLQIYVELRDKNYPGSIYQLEYDEASDQLVGTYYQAVARQTFEVRFARKE